MLIGVSMESTHALFDISTNTQYALALVYITFFLLSHQIIGLVATQLFIFAHDPCLSGSDIVSDGDFIAVGKSGHINPTLKDIFKEKV